MNLEEILLGGGGVLLAAMTLIQVAPIKVNPWSAIAKAIGRAINGEVIAKVDQLEREMCIRDRICTLFSHLGEHSTARPSPM